MPRLILLLTTVIWGATFPATKAALDQIPPLSFLCLRFFLGTLLVWAWFALASRRLVREKPVLIASAAATL
ncbi:MAG: EamA family transporter, partial [Nitrospira sp.]|nr:EamA family transporter [Nitrospira sp.]